MTQRSARQREATSWAGGLRDDLRMVWAPYVVARVLVGFGWLLAVGVASRYYAVQPVQIGEGLMAWDGTWYRDIAERGYQSMPAEGLRFFPLYPMFGRVLAAPFGGSSSVWLVVIANVSALALAVVIRRLVLLEKGDEAIANRAVWTVMLFPSAFVFVFAYAESLMVLAAAGAFLSARRGRWWLAAICGLVAGGARPVGVAVAAAMLVEAVRAWRAAAPRDWFAPVVAVVAPVVGAGAYLMWVARTFGSWSLPFRVQEDLRGEALNPVLRVLQGLGDVFGAERFGDGLHIPFAIAFVVLLVITFRRWPASYGAYATLVLVAALSATNLNSIERYALNAFPIVLTLALLLTRERWERVGLAACGGGLVALASLAWLRVYVP